jgi:uncharacterized protein (DUF362 family)
MNSNSKDFSRRWFLKSAACAAGVSIVGPRAFGKEKEPPVNQEVIPPTRIYPAMPLATVAMVGVKDSIYAAVQEAVMAAGGLDEIKSGQTVMIKPNMCGPAIKDKYPGRITTNPEVIRAVIKLVKARGAKVYVGDRSMLSTDFAFKSSGFEQVCKEEGAIGLPWTKCEYVRFFPKKRHWSQGFRIPKILTEVDHFINVPLLKNHGVGGADFTCCMKSYVGVCFPKDRHLGGTDELHLKNISEKVAELNLSVKPTINIVDAIEIMVNGGPDGLSKKRSVWCKSNLVMASKDRVACDSLALAVLKRYASEKQVDLPYVKRSVWDQPQIYYGAELGIGQAEPKNIKINDVKAPLFDEIKSNWV